MTVLLKRLRDWRTVTMKLSSQGFVGAVVGTVIFFAVKNFFFICA